MKKVLFLMVFCISIGNTFAQKSEIVVQAGHSGFMSFTGVDDVRNIMVSYGAYDEKLLKFWNSKNGILLKTIALDEHAKGVGLDKKNGIIYLGTPNEILAYSLSSFDLVKTYAVENLSQLVFSQFDENVYFFTGDYDTLQKGFFKLNPDDAQISHPTSVEFPSEGTVLDAKTEANGRLIKFYTEYQETFYYPIDDRTFFNYSQDPPLAVFDNYDFLFINQISVKNVKVTRYNAYEQKVIWEKTIVTEQLDKNNSIRPSQVSITPDNKYVWIAPGKSTLIHLDASTGDVAGVIYNKNKKSGIISDNHYVYTLQIPEGKFFAKGNYVKYKPYNINPVAKFGSILFNPITSTFDKNAKNIDLYTSNLDDRIFSLLNNQAASYLVEYDNKGQKSYAEKRIKVGEDDTHFYFITQDENQGIIKFEKGKVNSYQKVTGFPKNFMGFAADIKRKQYALFDKTFFEVYAFNQNTPKSKITLPDVVHFFPSSIEFSPDGDKLLVAINDEEIFEAQYERRLDYYDIKSQKQVWTLPDAYAQAKHLKNGNIIGVNVTKNTVDLISKNGQITKSFPIEEIDFSAEIYLSPNEETFLIASYQRPIITYSMQTGKKLGQTLSKSYKHGFFSNDIFYKIENNFITFYNAQNHKEVLRLYLFNDNQWIAHTPNGQFDGSQDAWERLVFVKGKETIPLNQVFDTFYTPRLMYKIANGETLETIDIEYIKEAPKVVLNYAEGSRNLIVEDDVESIETENKTAKITVSATSKGSSIAEVRLYHNDKLVSQNTRNLIVEEDEDSNEKIYLIDLLEGDNEFRAIAANAQGTESLPQSILVNYKAKASELPTPQGIQVYLMVVGINEYKNPKYNLNYAVADATGFKEKLQNGIQKISSSVNETMIFNAEANKEKIKSEFLKIIAKANPQDIFIFYYAGHGVITTDDAKEFYLVPHDVTQLYGAEDALRQKGFSAKELKELAAHIPAQKQLYILDACQSAGALDVVAIRGAAEEKAIAQLARSTGTHWLTASGSEQFATEFDELGHGVFTYVLLQALSGKADSGDGRITVNELKAYLESQVPEVSDEYKGSPQYPASFGFGQDFPIGVVK